MNTDAAILDALPTGTIVSYVGFEDLTYSWTKRPDGRWVGRYITAAGTLCANGIRPASVVARDVATGRNVEMR